MTFKQALAHHLAAIQQRDLRGFRETVVQDERLMVILPNGKVIQGFNDVLTFHTGWFNDQDWRLETKQISLVEGDSLSTALLLVDYQDLNADGEPYSMSYYLSLTFTFEQGKWLMLFDQNTLVSN
ncbi:hypothetical protein ACFSJ3_17100 [Corallincola platygyrae]|uniref:SnoaL-like domain-containing protein n=1 Tax=Corallincola platygyrae TaxID=1193278 RepID=A0ABW4XQ53_9GAMM